MIRSAILIIFAVRFILTVTVELPLRLPPTTVTCSNASMEVIILEAYEILQNVINPYLASQYGPVQDCGGSGWIKIIDLNMSDSSNTCPTGFTHYDVPVRSCGRQRFAVMTKATFSTEDPYSHVCGRITAIQKGSPDGFGPSFFHGHHYPIHFIDGITIRHGSIYNEGHIWTFAAGASEEHKKIRQSCPCAVEWHYPLPAFVGSDYFCETGNHGRTEDNTTFINDPLWNGKGCVNDTKCCEFNNPPWFFKKLPEPTTDNLEVVILLNGHHSEEDVFITEMELYVSP